ncbi:MAG: DUF320 domain-containing protein, partial [Azonexus sp.]|nr:DUF320 domain-containing protein [Azonexus sp.]MBP9229173.1 DUF320 domain-containing protein [Azonexus sp.]
MELSHRQALGFVALGGRQAFGDDDGSSGTCEYNSVVCPINAPINAIGGSVQRVLSATMHSLKLCTVASGFATLAAVEAGAGAHSYSVWRNRMSRSGA